MPHLYLLNIVGPPLDAAAAGQPGFRQHLRLQFHEHDVMHRLENSGLLDRSCDFPEEFSPLNLRSRIFTTLHLAVAGVLRRRYHTNHEQLMWEYNPMWSAPIKHRKADDTRDEVEIHTSMSMPLSVHLQVTKQRWQDWQRASLRLTSDCDDVLDVSGLVEIVEEIAIRLAHELV